MTKRSTPNGLDHRGEVSEFLFVHFEDHHLAFGDDGSLYVDRYDPGDIYRIEVKGGKAGKATKLQTSRALVNTDAIRPLGNNRFLLVEGGGRVDRMTIKGDSAIVETRSLLLDLIGPVRPVTQRRVDALDDRGWETLLAVAVPRFVHVMIGLRLAAA